jgi:hypothetical protein
MCKKSKTTGINALLILPFNLFLFVAPTEFFRDVLSQEKAGSK